MIFFRGFSIPFVLQSHGEERGEGDGKDAQSWKRERSKKAQKKGSLVLTSTPPSPPPHQRQQQPPRPRASSRTSLPRHHRWQSTSCRPCRAPPGGRGGRDRRRRGPFVGGARRPARASRPWASIRWKRRSGGCACPRGSLPASRRRARRKLERFFFCKYRVKKKKEK